MEVQEETRVAIIFIFMEAGRNRNTTETDRQPNK